MTCCPENTIPFVNQATSTIPFTGDKPLVTVSYFIDGVWRALGVMTQIRFVGSNIEIDHGGAATGIIKLT